MIKKISIDTDDADPSNWRPAYSTTVVEQPLVVGLCCCCWMLVMMLDEVDLS